MVVAAGFWYNLPDPAAAMGRVQLNRSPSMHARRQELAENYLDAFSAPPLHSPRGRPPKTPTRGTCSSSESHLRPCEPDNFIAALAEQGVGTSVHFIPLHLHTVWRQSLGLSPHQFPNANDQFEHAVSLPLFSSG